MSALDQKELLIKQVAASDCATAVLTKSGEVYLLTGYQCRKVIYRLVSFVIFNCIQNTVNKLIE